MSIEAIGAGSSSWFAQQLQSQQSDKSDFESKFSEKMISEQDENGDGLLQLDETKLTEDAFNELDTDGDGSVSQDELETGLQARMEQVRQMMEMSGITPSQPTDAAEMAEGAVGQLDSDGDGALSQTESGVSSSTFDELDLNEDGVVSADELAQAMENGVGGLEALFEQLRPSDDSQQASNKSGDENVSVSMDQMRRATMTYQENMSNLMAALFNTGTSSTGAESDEQATGVSAATLLQESVDLTI